MDKLELKDLNMQLIKDTVENRSSLVLDVDEFVSVGLFSDDFYSEDKLNKLDIRQRNKKIANMNKMREEGFCLDLQTLNVLLTCYNAIKYKNQKKIKNEILKDPFALLAFIDLCWRSVKTG